MAKRYAPFLPPWAGPTVRPGPFTGGFPTPAQQGIYTGPRTTPLPGKTQGK